MTEKNIHVSFHQDFDAFCTTCGYNLRGVSGAAYPECGSVFELASPQPEARYGLYLVALLKTFVLSTGMFGMLFWVIVAVQLDFSFWEDPVRLVEHAVSMIAVPCFILLLVWRRWISRWDIKGRLMIAIPPALLYLASVAWMLASALRL